MPLQVMQTNVQKFVQTYWGPCMYKQNYTESNPPAEKNFRENWNKERDWELYQAIAVYASSIRRKLHEASYDFLVSLFLFSSCHFWKQMKP